MLLPPLGGIALCLHFDLRQRKVGRQLILLLTLLLLALALLRVRVGKEACGARLAALEVPRAGAIGCAIGGDIRLRRGSHHLPFVVLLKLGLQPREHPVAVPHLGRQEAVVLEGQLLEARVEQRGKAPDPNVMCSLLLVLLLKPRLNISLLLLKFLMF